MTTFRALVLDSLTTVIPCIPFNYFTDIPSYAYVERKISCLIGFIDDQIHVSITLGCSVLYVFICIEV